MKGESKMINKKGYMDSNFVFGFFMLLIVFIFGGFGYVLIGEMSYLELAKDSSCDDLGMEYYYIKGFSYCVDNFGNLNNVMIKCEGFMWNKKCSVKFINLYQVVCGEIKNV